MGTPFSRGEILMINLIAQKAASGGGEKEKTWPTERIDVGGIETVQPPPRKRRDVSRQKLGDRSFVWKSEKASKAF
jgi:hypothetical protein